jgi:hypothetical protein
MEKQSDRFVIQNLYFVAIVADGTLLVFTSYIKIEEKEDNIGRQLFVCTGIVISVCKKNRTEISMGVRWSV